MTIRDLANVGLSDKSFMPGISAINLPPGIYDGWRVIVGDSNLLASNIKAGQKIFNVTGTFTSDATATPSQILYGQTAYVNGSKYTGIMTNNGATVLTASGTGNVPIPAGYHNGSGYVQQVSIDPATVLKTATIAGVTGSITVNPPNQITPSTTQQTLQSGYYDPSHEPFVAAEPNLVASNIVGGTSIFGVAGSAKRQASGTVTSASSLTSIPSAYTDGTASSASLAAATVTGLNFTPSMVVLIDTTNGEVVTLTSKQAIPTGYNNMTAINQNVGSFVTSVNGSLVSGGFTAYVRLTSTSYNWYAYE